MKTTTVQLLPTTTYGTPSGNYDGSSLDWSGDDQKAANYYGGFGQLQTVAFYLLNFQGLIRIEATLESEPTVDADWFKVNDFDSTSSATTNNFSVNITGNFTWIRATVLDFEAGTITKVTMSY
jgi:hypothetical protein